MLRRQRIKAEIFSWKSEKSKAEPFERLRFIAATKLCVWHEHEAGGGSRYIIVGDSLTLRFADHENISNKFSQPDFNFVNRYPTAEEFEDISGLIYYPDYVKKTAFAMHVGLTVPKLKKILTADCYVEERENEAFPNTYTEFVSIDDAFEPLLLAGIELRIPIRQEIYSLEDYCGAR
jgi:hypothetical protein